jgi:uncharacterized membrane protein YqiK
MKISPAVGIVVVILAVIAVLFFGFRSVKEEDATDAIIKHYNPGNKNK